MNFWAINIYHIHFLEIVMQISVNRREFYTALVQLNKIVPSRASHPVLAGIKVVATDSRIELTAFDLKCALKVFVDAVISEPGEMVIPGKLLMDSVAKMTEDEILITSKPDNRVIIKSKKAKFELACYDANDYPSIELLSDESVASTLNAESFIAACESVSGSASSDDTRQILTGVHFSSKNGELKLYATNGHVLSRFTLTGESSVTGITVPKFVINTLESIKPKGDLFVQFDDRIIVFTGSNYTLIGRLLEGHYPACEQLIPASYSGKALIKRRELLSALNGVMVVSDKSSLVSLEFNASGSCLLSSQSQDVGDANFEIECDYSGEQSKFYMNAKYLVAGLNANGEDLLEVNFNKPNQPLTITSDGSLFLIMPVEVKS